MNKRRFFLFIFVFMTFTLSSLESGFLRKLLDEPETRNQYIGISTDFIHQSEAAYIISLTSLLITSSSQSEDVSGKSDTGTIAAPVEETDQKALVVIPVEAVTAIVEVVEKAAAEGRLEEFIEVLKAMEESLPEDLEQATEEVRNQALSIRMSLALAYGLSGNRSEAERYEEKIRKVEKRLPPLAVALFADYGINLSSTYERTTQRRLANLTVAEAKKYGLGIFEFINDEAEAKRWIEMALVEREWDFSSLLLEESLKRTLISQSYFKGRDILARSGKKTNELFSSMIILAPGNFMMGNSQGAANEKPARSVTLTKAYVVSPYQITFELVDLYCMANGIDLPSDQGWGRSNRPAININWYQAVLFANWLSSLQGLSSAYTVDGDKVSWNKGSDGFRLPTEAEWEYTARGGEKNSGSSYAGTDKIENIAWFKENSGGMTHPVGQKSSNELGLYDMCGNVWEWCWDSFKADYYVGSPGEDPGGPDTATLKVVRGGSWNDTKPYLTNSFRFYFESHRDDRRLGFRLVRSL